MKKVTKVIGLLILLLVAVGCAIYMFNDYKSSSIANDKVEFVSENKPKEELPVANVATSSNAQPKGYGVEREITGELKNNQQSSGGVGSIDFSGVGANTFDIVGKLAEDKDTIMSMIKKENKVYTSSIDWTYGNISVDQYKALIAACGQMYEDELNEEQLGRYTVEANIPPADAVDEMGIEVLFDVDENGYLTLWTDIITRDSRDNSEIEEIKSFTLYYDGNVLTFKK